MELETFKALVIPVKDKLFRFAFRIVQSEEEANDIVQEAFLRIWKNIEKLKEASNAEAWCMTVTKNLALDTVKSKKRKMTQSIEESTMQISGGVSTDARVENSDMMLTIHQIISKLPEKQQQVMHLRDIEGYTYEEICDIMEINMNQVKVSLHRARQNVKEKLLIKDGYGI